MPKKGKISIEFIEHWIPDILYRFNAVTSANRAKKRRMLASMYIIVNNLLFAKKKL
jgi:hypothetical protein